MFPQGLVVARSIRIDVAIEVVVVLERVSISPTPFVHAEGPWFSLAIALREHGVSRSLCLNGAVSSLSMMAVMQH